MPSINPDTIKVSYVLNLQLSYTRWDCTLCGVSAGLRDYSESALAESVHAHQFTPGECRPAQGKEA